MVPLQEEIVGGSRRPLLILLGAVGLVLLLGIANVTALALARGQARRSELALRSAIGAGRVRILRQVTFENLLLSLLGGLGGAALAAAGLGLVRRTLPFRLPRLEEVSIDARVLGFALCASLLTALLVGAWITLQGTASSLSDRLRGLVRGGRTGSSRFGLVAFELAIAVILLAGAGLLIRSFMAVTAVDPGFETERRLTFRVGLPEARYPEESWSPFFEQLEERLASLPGVSAVGLNPWIPFSSGWFFSYRIMGQPEPEPGRGPSAAFRFINDDYFEAMGMPMIQGRSFDSSERPGSLPVVVVNEAFVRRNFDRENPIGQRITVGYRNPSDGPVERTIVGVSGDVHQFRLGSQTVPCIYVPFRQLPFDVMTVVLQTKRDPLTLAQSARAVIKQLDPELAVERIESMEQRVSGSLGRQRFLTLLLSLFASIAILIAAVGVYALLAHNVATRNREIGVRIAMGAHGGHLARWVLRQLLLLTATGFGVGLIAAFALGRLLNGLLFGVSAADPTTFFLATLAVLALGLLAACVPVGRALRVDPITVLRSD